MNVPVLKGTLFIHLCKIGRTNLALDVASFFPGVFVVVVVFDSVWVPSNAIMVKCFNFAALRCTLFSLDCGNILPAVDTTGSVKTLVLGPLSTSYMDKRLRRENIVDMTKMRTRNLVSSSISRFKTRSHSRMFWYL